MKNLQLFKIICLFLLPTLTRAQINGSFNFGGQSRTFIIHLPAGYTAGQSLPLVFVLHGFTQSASAIQSVTGFDNLSDAENFIAVYPNGISNAWNTNSGFPGGSTADDVGFIGALIDTMHASYNIDLSRVYSCGFSAGGFMSHRLACESTARFAAIASVSGTMSDAAFNACSPSKPIPVMQIHGTSDGIVSYTGGIGGKGVDDIISFWKDFQNCPSTASFTALPDTVSDGSNVEKYEYRPCDSCSVVTLLKVVNGGHQWPGTTNAAGGLGNINRDISATKEIWNFFNQFSNTGCQFSTLAEESEIGIGVYPNPASDLFYVETKSSLTQQLRISDMSGRVLHTQELNSGLNTVDVSRINGGIYMVHIVCGDVLRSALLSVVR